MSKSKTFSGFGGICLAVILLVTFQHTCGQQRLCGQGLRQTLDIICPHGFNGYKTKRGDSLMPEDDYNTDSNDEDDNFVQSFDLLPFFTNMESNSLAKTRRRRHGVTHECCDKPCKLSELRSYCRRQ